MSGDDEISGEGYVWRKYGEKTVGAKKKAVRRSYYRCVCSRARGQCMAKKRVDRLVCAASDDPPLAVCFVNRHSHNAGLDGGEGGEGSYEDGETRGRRGLESMRAEDLALEMYKDLVSQLEQGRGANAGQGSLGGDNVAERRSFTDVQMGQSSFSGMSGSAGDALSNEFNDAGVASGMEDHTLSDPLPSTRFGRASQPQREEFPFGLQQSLKQGDSAAPDSQETYLPALQQPYTPFEGEYFHNSASTRAEPHASTTEELGFVSPRQLILRTVSSSLSQVVESGQVLGRSSALNPPGSSRAGDYPSTHQLGNEGSCQEFPPSAVLSPDMSELLEILKHELGLQGELQGLTNQCPSTVASNQHFPHC